MAEHEKSLVKRPVTLARFDPNVCKELIIRGLSALAEVKDADFYFFRGDEYRVRGDLHLAISSYEKALQIDPKHESSLLMIGCCYYFDVPPGGWGLEEEEVWERAATAFKRYVEVQEEKDTIGPESPGIYCYIGHCLSELNRDEEAIESYKRGIELMSNQWPHRATIESVARFFFIGYLSGELDRYKEAIKSHKQGIELGSNPWLDSKLAYAYRELGHCQKTLGRYEEALESFQHALKHIRNESTFKPLGSCLEKLGRYEEATEIYELAIKEEKLPFVRNRFSYLRGCVLSHLGRHEEATKCYERALEERPSNRWDFYQNGLVLARLGRHQEAIESFKQSLELEKAALREYQEYLAEHQKESGEAIERYKQSLELGQLGWEGAELDDQSRLLMETWGFLDRDAK